MRAPLPGELSARGRLLDLLIAMALCCGALVEIWILDIWGIARGQATLAALVLGAAVALRRTAPLLVLAVVGGASLLVLVDVPVSGSQDSLMHLLVLLVVSYSTGAYTSERWRVVVGGVGVLGLAALLAVSDPEPGLSVGDAFFFALLLGAPWTAGAAIRLHRYRAEKLEHRADELVRTQDERALAAVAEERMRIARELHDIVAHGVSVMTLQARGGARVLDTEPAEAAQAFASIEQTGRRSLVEMRRLLGVLRYQDGLLLAPQPGLDELPELVERARRSGVAVEVEHHGVGLPIPPAVDLTAFRVVQEALTNAVRHAAGGQAMVRVSVDAHDVRIDVVTSTPSTAAAAVAASPRQSTGFGLIGMRERVAIFEGDLDVGLTDDGRFAVRARLPMGGAER